MKYLSVLCYLAIVLSCGVKQNSVAELNNKQDMQETEECPENGSCFLEVFPNTSLDIKHDNLWALYPELVKGETLVLTFEYKRDEIPNTMDSSYREILYIELESQNIEIEKEGANLKDVKLLFARLCFCKGQTGYYEISDGHLKISKNTDDTYNLYLEFSTDEVPQILNKISHSFSLPKAII